MYNGEPGKHKIGSKRSSGARMIDPPCGSLPSRHLSSVDSLSHPPCPPLRFSRINSLLPCYLYACSGMEHHLLLWRFSCGVLAEHVSGSPILEQVVQLEMLARTSFFDSELFRSILIIIAHMSCLEAKMINSTIFLNLSVKALDNFSF